MRLIGLLFRKIMKNIIQNLLRPFNVRIQQLPTKEEVIEEERKKNQWLRDLNIKTIIDIGANTGQLALELSKIFPEAYIYSFEPLEDCYKELLSLFKGHTRFQAFNMALGNENGEIEIHRNKFSPSTSLLPMTELHKESFPYTKDELIERVEIKKLDDVINDINLKHPLLIKLDVQGFEDKVIQGGKSTFSKADIIIIELSVEVLYEGQKLFDEIYETLKDLGFQYRGNYGQLNHPNDGRVLQMDGIFIKNK
jgi:FkbM family methyltransferase